MASGTCLVYLLNGWVAKVGPTTLSIMTFSTITISIILSGTDLGQLQIFVLMKQSLPYIYCVYCPSLPFLLISTIETCNVHCIQKANIWPGVTMSNDTSFNETSSNDTSSKDTSSNETSSNDTSSNDTSSNDTSSNYVNLNDISLNGTSSSYISSKVQQY